MNLLTKLVAAAGAALVIASPLAAAAQGYHTDRWQGREDHGRGDSQWRDRDGRGDQDWRRDESSRRDRDWRNNDDRRGGHDRDSDWRGRGW